MRLLVIILSVLLCASASAADVQEMSHPRLFLRQGQEKALVKNIRSDRMWTRMHDAIVAECDTICRMDPMERILDGPRLHAVSCEVLRRVLFLSYAYRTTGVEKYADRAEKEMLHVCGFVDWNPSHYLDVAEMSTALAIGYDWLYDRLGPAEKQLIVKNIVEKGLKPSEDSRYNQAYMTKHSRFSNWGQVCHGGLGIAAMAVITEEKELAERILERSRERIMLPMEKAYPPEGCYPEGFGYWAFGTQYNILFVSALEGLFGSKAVECYKEVPGFVQSGHFSQQLITPSLHTFGYSDNSTRIYLEPAVMWFNTVAESPEMYYMQKRLFDKFDRTRSYVKTIKNRIIPMMLIWGAGTGKKPAVRLDRARQPESRFYVGNGSNSICVMRSGWDKDDSYLGLKSGRPDNFHGHMDIGSFYYEADGVRWSMDLGSDHYGHIAAAKVGMFRMTQDSQRWNLLTRYNNFAHSTTWPEGVMQEVGGQCRIEESSSEGMWASTDITPVYSGSLRKIARKVSLEGRSAVIEDTVVADEDLDMVWNMTTEAVRIDVDKATDEIRLYAYDGDGKERMLRMKVLVDGTSGYEVEFVPALPRNDFETPIEGVYWLRVRYGVKAGDAANMKVKLIPTDITR